MFTSRSCNGDKYGDNDGSNDDPRRRALLFAVLAMISLLLENGFMAGEKRAELDVRAAENGS